MASAVSMRPLVGLTKPYYFALLSTPSVSNAKVGFLLFCLARSAVGARDLESDGNGESIQEYCIYIDHGFRRKHVKSRLLVMMWVSSVA